MRCCVLTPDRGRVYDEFVDSVEVHTTAGRLEIFHRFEPTIAPLRIGVAKAKGNDGSVAALAIHGGYMNMNGKVLLILADSAELGDEINLERAQKALDRARELLAKVTSDHADSVEIDIDRAKLAITRALTRLNIAREAPYPNHDRTRDREVF
ncbi:MAG: ATP synthase F1 subunit epsilon [Planctomycetota bacterium]|nr:ATP synthase F1 subunit epsilon [Planctomycetota bacterium]